MQVQFVKAFPPGDLNQNCGLGIPVDHDQASCDDGVRVVKLGD